MAIGPGVSRVRADVLVVCWRRRPARASHWPSGCKSRMDCRVEKADPAIWKVALEAAERVRAKIAPADLPPYDDFAWGMLNGKLSALRWVLGDEWDFLDT